MSGYLKGILHIVASQVFSSDNGYSAGKQDKQPLALTDTRRGDDATPHMGRSFTNSVIHSDDINGIT